MQRSLTTLALSLALASGVCTAQSQSTGQTSPAPSQSSPTTQQPQQPQQPMPNQSQPADPNRPPNSDDNSNNKNPNAPQTDTPTAAGDAAGTIQSALQKDPGLANSDINVRMSDKGVMLEGTVASQDQKQLAEQIATQNAGGQKVNNKLKVNSHRSQPNSGPGGSSK